MIPTGPQGQSGQTLHCKVHSGKSLPVLRSSPRATLRTPRGPAAVEWVVLDAGRRRIDINQWVSDRLMDAQSPALEFRRPRPNVG